MRGGPGGRVHRKRSLKAKVPNWEFFAAFNRPLSSCSTRNIQRFCCVVLSNRAVIIRGGIGMIGAPATLTGMAGMAVLLASFAPAAVGGHPSAQVAPAASVEIRKGDRITPPVAAKNRASVSSVELVGVSNATVILRDRSGAVLFRSDPLT